MLFAIRRSLNSSRSVYKTIWNGVRYFESAVVKDLPKKSLEDRIKRVYEQLMQRDDIPLLSSFEDYARSLPARKFPKRDDIVGTSRSEFLYKYPYWSCEKDLADRLVRVEKWEGRTPRGLVKYLAAPSQHGKSCSILPAFLYSAEKRLASNDVTQFTHYLHLPFYNNDGNYFEANGKINENYKVAREQGSAFILECLKSLLKNKLSENIEIDPSPSPQSFIIKEIESILSSFGQAKFLVHLDEHRHMYDSSEESTSVARFRRGALEVLAMVSGVTHVATFTGMPQLPTELSSGVCRYPLPMPSLDLNLMTKDLVDLTLPAYDSENNEQRRYYSTLCFRLRMKVKQMGYLQISNEITRKFLRDFKAACQEKDGKALIQCIHLCQFRIRTSRDTNVNAVKLLLGVDETKVDDAIQRQIHEMLVIGELVTSSLENLLTIHDPGFPIYSIGRNSLANVLSSANTINFNSQTPLEAAYSWYLSCYSAMYGELSFGPNIFEIKCNLLESYRLFNGHDTTDYANYFKNMDLDTIYYVEERKGNETHPLCDIFFRTHRNQLVLIDVTGGAENLVAKKVLKLSKWIEEEQKQCRINATLHGVILAPLCKSAVDVHHDNMVVLCGDEAQALLGGLQQLL